MKASLLTAGLVGLFAGCMDPVYDYDECVTIEKARCALRQSCQGQDEVFDDRFDDFDYDTCVAYAREHCRTRKIKGTDTVSQDQLNACVAAIKTVPCNVLDPAVDETAALPECSFIEKPDEDPDSGPVDAGPTSDAAS